MILRFGPCEGKSLRLRFGAGRKGTNEGCPRTRTQSVSVATPADRRGEKKRCKVWAVKKFREVPARY